MAEAVTREGERLLRRFRFTLVAGPKGRKDPFSLYSVTFTSDISETALSDLPDWSKRVRLDWLPQPAVAASRTLSENDDGRAH